MSQFYQYVLDRHGHHPVSEPDFMKWAQWMDSNKVDGQRRVAIDRLKGVRVSTIFLGLDHNFTGIGEAILWETMVFRGERFEEIEKARCSGTRLDAMVMHHRMVHKIRCDAAAPDYSPETEAAQSGKKRSWWRKLL